VTEIQSDWSEIKVHFRDIDRDTMRSTPYIFYDVIARPQNSKWLIVFLAFPRVSGGIPRFFLPGERDDQSIRSQFRFYRRRQTVSPALCRCRSALGHLCNPSRSRGFPKISFRKTPPRKHPHQCCLSDMCLIVYDKIDVEKRYSK
jgi:hypothetical protein